MTKERVAGLPAETREALAGRIKRCLDLHPEIAFAYVHGSFVTEERCNDIDVAVYLDLRPDSPLDIELALERELGDIITALPVDVRVLNQAPLSFRYNVIRFGRPLLVRNDDLRSDFVTATLARYFDFAPYRRRYLKETLGVGV